MPPNTYDKVALYYTEPIMAAMTVYSTYWFVYLLKNSRLRWFQFMLFLCVLQNINTFWLGILHYLTVSPFL